MGEVLFQSFRILTILKVINLVYRKAAMPPNVRTQRIFPLFSHRRKVLMHTPKREAAVPIEYISLCNRSTYKKECMIGVCVQNWEPKR